jgi:hypothetical protein
MPASVNSTFSLLDSGLPDFVTKRLAGMARSYGCPDITSHLAVVL